MTGFLYAFDPSTKATGVAVFLGSALERVDVIEAKSVEAMIKEVQAYLAVLQHSSDFAVIETPRYYPRAGSIPKALLKITQIVGAIRAHFPTSKTYTPQQWNHGRPKAVTETRIKDLLSASEIAKVEQIRAGIRNNAWDAIGIGLHHLGRLT